MPIIPSTTNQITGGSFTDSDGNILTNGYLLFKLSQDAVVNGNTLVCSGSVIKVPLDSNGNIITSPVYKLWPNTVLNPSDTFYLVSAYSAIGQLVWGPNPLPKYFHLPHHLLI